MIAAATAAGIRP